MNTTLTLEQPLLSMLPGVAVTEVDTVVTETGNNNGHDYLARLWREAEREAPPAPRHPATTAPAATERVRFNYD